MTAKTIQAKYAELENVVSVLDELALQAKNVHYDLKDKRGALQGEWVGFGSDRFFEEMDDGVLRGTERLITALHSAATLVHQTSAEFLATEMEEAAKFRVIPDGEKKPPEQIPPEKKNYPEDDPNRPGPKEPQPEKQNGQKDATPLVPFHNYPVCNTMECKNVTMLGLGVSVDTLPIYPVSNLSWIVGLGFDLGTLALDLLELGTSIAGLQGQALATAIGSIGGPVGAILSALLAGWGVDAFETGLSLITLSGDALGDFFQGKTFRDPATGDIVVGQATMLGSAEFSIDALTPAMPVVDVVLNVAGLYGSISGLMNPDSFQVRFGKNGPYIVHTTEVQDPVLKALAKPFQ